MRVALLNPVYWPEVRRGSERFARELADGLRARGHEPRIVTSHRGLPRRDIEDGVEVVRVPRPPAKRLDRRLYEHHLTHVPFSELELRRHGADVAHALYPTDALAALRWGGPTVFSYMGVPHRQGLANRRWRKEIMVRVTRDAGAVVALSELAAKGFRRWLGVDPHVIPPPVDVAAFTPGGTRAAATTVVCPADRTEPRKRVDLLIDAVGRIDGARLILDRRGAGGTDIAQAFVELRDLDDRAALAAAYREAHVAALPSWGEAFGLVLVESMACGTPAVGPTAELYDRPGIGEPFDGDDPTELAAALERAIAGADPDACRERAQAFSVQRCAAAYERLYDAVRR
jgi:glycosyltransferase involved in cell wall biosynthesis